jgi:mannose-6-phosphate isomerase
MTNRNLDLNRGTKPFLLKPVGKDYLWGGSRLNDDFSKGIEMSPLAETWECSTHQDGASIIASGEYEGKTLTELLREHPEYLGTHSKFEDNLPILIKFIDAKNNLSVQVHPDDDYARLNENGQLGKTEMWYVLDATKDAKLVYGLNRDMDKESLRKSINEGTVEQYLQTVPIRKDDLFYIQSGTIHAIGAGALIAEIQENSNLTYRLYDYDRVDKNGNKRELHIDKALNVANLKASATPRQPLRVLKYRQGCASELLCRCQYFEVHRMLVNTERCRQLVGFKADSISFRVLLCTDGCGSIYYGENEALRFFKGDCIFVPARSVDIMIHGKAQFLDVRG